MKGKCSYEKVFVKESIWAATWDSFFSLVFQQERVSFLGYGRKPCPFQSDHNSIRLLRNLAAKK